MSPLAVSVQGVSKKYVKYEDRHRVKAGGRSFGLRTRRHEFWALRDLDLDVAHGECVGIIGRNGSGKSTLLRMLAGVTAPSEGMVTVRGRVAPLVGVGVGFHPEMTGRENIYFNGAILGLDRQEVDKRVEGIVDFADIGDFLDTPVKFYSSGMYVRLGFAVAVQADPDVLLVDEVLSVGDMPYQVKCFRRLGEIRRSGTTVVVVSHNLGAIQLMCDRTAVLDHGRLVYDGDTDEAISRYHQMLVVNPDMDEAVRVDPLKLPGVARIESYHLLDSSGAVCAHFKQGEPMTLRLGVRFVETLQDPVFNCIITSENGSLVYKEPSLFQPSGSFAAGTTATFDVTVTANLPTGSYSARSTLQTHDLGAELDIAGPLSFYVTGRGMVGGTNDLMARFEVRR